MVGPDPVVGTQSPDRVDPVRNFLFLLREYPDIDHIAPLIWKCLEKGDRTFVIFDRPYPYGADYRLQFLTQYPGFQVLGVWGVGSPSRLTRIVSRIIWKHYLRSLLRRYRISACFFEGGEGVLLNGRFRSLKELQRIGVEYRAKKSVADGMNLRAVLSRVIERIVLKPLRSQLIIAAKRNGLPIFALPHGVGTKLNLDYNPKARAIMSMSGGKIPSEDRNCFDAWVVTAEVHRDMMINQMGMNPAIVKIWGSLRFCPQWTEILKKICPSAALPPTQEGQVRLAFFLPKWRNLVNREATMALLTSLAQRPDIQLVIKTHPRKGLAELDESSTGQLQRYANVVLAGEAHSTGLVRDSDVVIDIGSGMAIDAMVQCKHLIYPAYLHKNRLVFDQCGGCLIAQSESDVHRFLDRIAGGLQPHLEGPEVQVVLRELIYGGREAFDVPEVYYTQVQRYLAGRKPEEIPEEGLVSSTVHT